MSSEKRDPVEILTDRDRKQMVDRLLQIMNSNDQRLAMRAILRLIAIEKQVQKDQHFHLKDNKQ